MFIRYHFLFHIITYCCCKNSIICCSSQTWREHRTKKKTSGSKNKSFCVRSAIKINYLERGFVRLERLGKICSSMLCVGRRNLLNFDIVVWLFDDGVILGNSRESFRVKHVVFLAKSQMCGMRSISRQNL